MIKGKAFDKQARQTRARRPNPLRGPATVTVVFKLVEGHSVREPWRATVARTDTGPKSINFTLPDGSLTVFNFDDLSKVDIKPVKEADDGKKKPRNPR